MRLGAVTYNVLKDWDIEKIITTLGDLGYEAVELRTTHKHGVEPSMGKEDRLRVRRRFEAGKVRLLSYGTVCEFHSPDAGERARQTALAKDFVVLAHDTGALGVKVRPNGLPKEVPRESTIANIGACLREVAEFGAGYGVEIWMEVHGAETQIPSVSAAILKAADHPNAGACWNSNPTDVVNGSVKSSFELLRRHIKNVHITELADPKYPWRELFTLLKSSGYDRYTLCEVQESPEPERFLRYYKALWNELVR